jgi:hypothetical protein
MTLPQAFTIFFLFELVLDLNLWARLPRVADAWRRRGQLGVALWLALGAAMTGATILIAGSSPIAYYLSPWQQAVKFVFLAATVAGFARLLVEIAATARVLRARRTPGQRAGSIEQ